MITGNEVFLDTSYVIALCSSDDKYYEKAKILADELETMKTKFVTTRAVIFEIGNALSKKRYRRDAINLINSLEVDPDVRIVPLSDELYHRAIQFYQARLDKEWGLTDCLSFIVMKDYGITESLTADRHFRQAGFKALLL